MSLTARLKASIDDCHLAVDEHPAHDLTLGRRRQLWRLMGTNQDANDQHLKSNAHRARYTLARIAIEKSIAARQSSRDVLGVAGEAMRVAALVMANEVTSEYAWQHHGDLWSACDNLAYRLADASPLICVGYGATQLIAVALRDEVFLDTNDPNQTDSDVDPDELDCSFCAAATCADGPVWEESSNSLKRRDFWHWWLNTAIPHAMQESASRQ